MLLNNTDLDPLNKDKHPEKIDGLHFLNKLIRVVPLLISDENTDKDKSKIVILFDGGNVGTNSDNENISVLILVYCPFE